MGLILSHTLVGVGRVTAPARERKVRTSQSMVPSATGGGATRRKVQQKQTASQFAER